MTQYVYLIECKNMYKIGVANDVQSRLASLQTGNPFPLVVMTCFGFENAEVIEKALHQRFSKARTRGEWFMLSDEEITNFIQLCKGLGGEESYFSNASPLQDEIEDAEEAGEYQPTIEDVERIIKDERYRLEYRYGDRGLRGFAWRLRNGNKESPLYIGKRSKIFEQVKAMLPECKP